MANMAGEQLIQFKQETNGIAADIVALQQTVADKAPTGKDTVLQPLDDALLFKLPDETWQEMQKVLTERTQQLDYTADYIHNSAKQVQELMQRTDINRTLKKMIVEGVTNNLTHMKAIFGENTKNTTECVRDLLGLVKGSVSAQLM